MYPREMRLQARAMRRQGHTNRETAAHLGVAKSTVDYWCRGVPRPAVVKSCRLCGEPFATRRRDGTYCPGRSCSAKARVILGWRVYESA